MATFYSDVAFSAMEGLVKVLGGDMFPRTDLTPKDWEDLENIGKAICESLKSKGMYVNKARNDPSGRW
jgi:hypothetical protein